MDVQRLGTDDDAHNSGTHGGCADLVKGHGVVHYGIVPRFTTGTKSTLTVIARRFSKTWIARRDPDGWDFLNAVAAEKIWSCLFAEQTAIHQQPQAGRLSTRYLFQSACITSFLRVCGRLNRWRGRSQKLPPAFAACTSTTETCGVVARTVSSCL